MAYGASAESNLSAKGRDAIRSAIRDAVGVIFVTGVVALAAALVVVAFARRHASEVGAPSASARAASSPRAPENIVRTAWDLKRAEEFRRCDAAHGIPTVGFDYRIVCLHASAVISVGESLPAPQ